MSSSMIGSGSWFGTLFVVYGQHGRSWAHPGVHSDQRVGRARQFVILPLGKFSVLLTVGACHCFPVAGGASGVTPRGYGPFVVSKSSRMPMILTGASTYAREEYP